MVFVAQYTQVSDRALQASVGPCSSRKTQPRDSQRQLQRTEQLTLYRNKRARGQQFSTAAQKSKSETRKILVMALTFKDHPGRMRKVHHWRLLTTALDKHLLGKFR